MREASIILPRLDNNGADLGAVHADFRAALCAAFGGYTAAPVLGGWTDEKSGEVYEDESLEYRVAANWGPVERQTLDDLADTFGRKAGQLAVYVKHGNGDVTVIEPRETAPVAPRDYQPGELYRARQEAKRARLARYALARAEKVARAA